jgi:glutathione S-transferase
LAQSNAIMLHLAEGSSLIPAEAYERALGRVDIHFSQIMAATRNSTAANDTTVFS